MNRTAIKLNPLNALKDLGVISNKIEDQIFVDFVKSAAGRAFGSPSAGSLPRQLIKVANACLNEIDRSNEEGRLRCREIVERNFDGRSDESVTHLNKLLTTIELEVRQGAFKVKTQLPENSDGRGFLAKILKFFRWQNA